MDWQSIAGALARWHDAQQRDLPWRAAPAGARDPYVVWISEVMAQQTRLATVEAYFVRWMRRFPDLRALAAADLQDVLKVWEGLGYYARARNLHRASDMVMRDFGGHLPRTRRELLALPGIGEYTAGAILSLAYGYSQPILDGNVKRVFSRLADIEASIDETGTVRTLWAMAGALVDAAPEGQAGIVNEGLMELGALVCTPGRPRCMVCPVLDTCEAAKHGTQADRPIRDRRRETPHYDVAAGVIWERGPFMSRMLIAQRPHDGMLGGLWEFPGGKLESDDASLRDCLRREIQEELGIAIAVGEPLVTVRHAYTHFRITLHAFHARHIEGNPRALECEDWRWATMDELASLPFPVTDQKIIAALQRHRNEAGVQPGEEA